MCYSSGASVSCRVHVPYSMFTTTSSVTPALLLHTMQNNHNHNINININIKCGNHHTHRI